MGALNVPLLQTPMSLATKCADGPLFVHRTVVPALIVRVAGENMKSWIITSTTEPLGIIPPPPLGGWLVVPPPPVVGWLTIPPPGAVGEPLHDTTRATSAPPPNVTSNRIVNLLA